MEGKFQNGFGWVWIRTRLACETSLTQKDELSQRTLGQLAGEGEGGPGLKGPYPTMMNNDRPTCHDLEVQNVS